VRVRADVVDLTSRKVVCSDGEPGLSDRWLARLGSAVAVGERRAQVAASLREAVTRPVLTLKDTTAKARTLQIGDVGMAATEAGC